MLRNPPHILVTTPESLYILLTAKRSREHLACVETVIVDEIHAVADDKRGAHLALSLERLDALVCGENRLSPGAFITGLMNPPQRIGLSATQNPIELVAEFLTGTAPHRAPATIVQVGQKKEMDIAIEVPSDELTSVTSQVMWEEIFDKLAAYTETHRSTLVFVNTRKLVERVSFALAERLGTENVGAHHGSLSRMLRLDAERRLKRGEIKILVATASLELGIDIGNIDLVCQISTTRSIAVTLAESWPRRSLARSRVRKAACSQRHGTICSNRRPWSASCAKVSWTGLRFLHSRSMFSCNKLWLRAERNRGTRNLCTKFCAALIRIEISPGNSTKKSSRSLRTESNRAGDGTVHICCRMGYTASCIPVAVHA